MVMVFGIVILHTVAIMIVVVMLVIMIFRVVVWNAIAIMVVIVVLDLAGVVILGVDEPGVVRLTPTRGQSQNRQRNPNSTHLVSP